MNIQDFIIVYLFILFTGTFAVTGWFFITRGKETVLEDGTKKRTGKVFKWWYFFWTQKKFKNKRIYFDEPHLFDLYLEIKARFYRNGRCLLSVKENSLTLEEPSSFIEEIRWVERAHNVHIYQRTEGSNIFGIYRIEEVFLFPWWVRDPLASCATCFSSIYGSIYYWLLIALIGNGLFEWSTYPVLASIFFWITFCFTLSITNTALAKKYN